MTPQEVWNTPSSTSHTSEAVLGMRPVRVDLIPDCSGNGTSDRVDLIPGCSGNGTSYRVDLIPDCSGNETSERVDLIPGCSGNEASERVDLIPVPRCLERSETHIPHTHTHTSRSYAVTASGLILSREEPGYKANC